MYDFLRPVRHERLLGGMKAAVIAALSAALTACYGSAPPVPPRVPLPPLADGAQIGVYSQTKTTIEQVPHESRTCVDGHPDECTTTTYSEAEPVSRTITTATYNDAPITYAQFRVITDPKWNDELAELDDLSHKCRRANIPRYAGMGLLAGGLIAGAIVKGDAGAALMYGGTGLGVGSYALGYFAYGGRDCVRARALFEQLDMSQAMSWTSVEGADYATEMKALADQFNASHGHGDTAALRMR